MVVVLFMSLLLVEVSEIMMMIDRFFVASLSLSRFFSCYPCSYCHRSCRVFNCSVLYLFFIVFTKKSFKNFFHFRNPDVYNPFGGYKQNGVSGSQWHVYHINCLFEILGGRSEESWT